MKNLENIQDDNKPKINDIFDIKECSKEIKKFGSMSGNIINIPIDPEKSINDLLIEFFKRIEKGNNINEIKNKFSFSYSNNKLDLNDKNRIKDFLNIKGILKGNKYFNIYVTQIF